MTSLLCRLGLHKWKDHGDVVLIQWREPGFVPSTTTKVQKVVHSERMCSRCGIMEKRIFADNMDGSKAAIGWEKIADKAQNSSH